MKRLHLFTFMWIGMWIGLLLGGITVAAGQTVPSSFGVISQPQLRLNEPVMVGIFSSPPFAIKLEDKWDGIGVHLWRDIARDLEFQSFADPQAGMQAVLDGKIEVFVGSKAVLRYVNNDAFKGGLAVQSKDIDPQRYAFAVAEDSALLEPLNQQIVNRTSGASWRALIERYMPEP